MKRRLVLGVALLVVFSVVPMQSGLGAAGAPTPDRFGWVDATGLWYLGNDDPFYFGNGATDVPFLGDWNGDGIDTPGVYRDGQWFQNSGTRADGTTTDFWFGGAPNDIPVVGDWDCNGTDTPGVFRDGHIFLSNVNATAFAVIIYWFGTAGDQPIAGDFNNDGCDTVSVFRNGRIFINDVLPSGAGSGGGPATVIQDAAIGPETDADPPALVSSDLFFGGAPGDQSGGADFNGNGVTTPSVQRGGDILIRNSLTTGAADAGFRFPRDSVHPIFGTQPEVDVRAWTSLVPGSDPDIAGSAVFRWDFGVLCYDVMLANAAQPFEMRVAMNGVVANLNIYEQGVVLPTGADSWSVYGCATVGGAVVEQLAANPAAWSLEVVDSFSFDPAGTGTLVGGAPPV